MRNYRQYLVIGIFKVPSETTIREFIKNFAKYITHKIYLTINNQNVSILIDEVTRNGAKYLGVVFFLPQKLFFLGLEPCQIATFNISTIVAKYAQYIDHNHSNLVSVCSLICIFCASPSNADTDIVLFFHKIRKIYNFSEIIYLPIVYDSFFHYSKHSNIICSY